MLKLSKAMVGTEELLGVQKVLFETVNFGLGIHVQKFEEELQEYIGNGVEVVCVSTGTAALHLALESLAFPQGSEVLVPSITFVASYSAISAAGLKPVSCEVIFPSCHIDCADLEKRITSKTVAIMPVAYAGCDFDRQRLYNLAEKYKLRVIEDDAHAFGSLNQDGLRFGASGDLVCFSFDGIKNITCGEGGALVSRNKEFLHQVRIRRSLGIEKDVSLRYQGQRAWEYDVSVQGFRYHMSNINAAIGSAQLRKFPSLAKLKREILEAYLEAFKKISWPEGFMFTQNIDSGDCLHIFSCLLPKGVDREQVRKQMFEKGYETGFHYVPNHTHSYYKSSYSLPIAEDLGARLISLPFHPSVPIASISSILQALRECLC